MPEMTTNSINMYDLLVSLTNAMDLADPELTDHHKMVTYLAIRIAHQVGLQGNQKKELLLASMLHDIGALSLHERLELIEEELMTAESHAFRGAELLEGLVPSAPQRRSSDITTFPEITAGAPAGMGRKSPAQTISFTWPTTSPSSSTGTGKSWNRSRESGALDPTESNVMRSHTFYTYRLLQPIRGFEVINEWASYHHERLNGTGYPFHLQGRDLSLGSRIMAVADIFTAITEDRPYRKGMSDEKTAATLRTMAQNNAICPYVTSVLFDHFEAISSIRKQAQGKAVVKYQKILETDES